jgi:hypothetical protein
VVSDAVEDVELVEKLVEKLVAVSIWVKLALWRTMPRRQDIAMTFKHFLLVVPFLD